jgi:hypothetical protein
LAYEFEQGHLQVTERIGEYARQRRRIDQIIEREHQVSSVVAAVLPAGDHWIETLAGEKIDFRPRPRQKWSMISFFVDFPVRV